MTDDMEYFGGIHMTRWMWPSRWYFQNLQKVLLVAQDIYSLPGIFRNLALEYPEPVFGAEDNIAFIDRV